MSVHTDRSDFDFVSGFDVGSIGMYSNIIGIGHFIGIGIGSVNALFTSSSLGSFIVGCEK